MKKLMFVAIFGMALGLTSCGSDDVVDALGLDCVTLSTDLATAAENYASDASAENCAAYKTAIERYQAEGCAGAGDLDSVLTGLGDCTAG